MNYPKELNDFLNYMKTIKGSSDLTVKEYGYNISSYLKFISLLDQGLEVNSKNISEIPYKKTYLKALEDVSLADLYSYLSYLDNDRKNAPTTRARKISALKAFYDYLYNKTDQISKNPTEKLQTPKKAKTKPIYLTLSEATKLLDVIQQEENDFIRNRDYAMVTLFLNLGLRLAELVGINLFDIKDGTLKVTGKGSKERVIYLNNSCIYSVNRYIAVRPKLADEKALFLSQRNKRISKRAVQYRVEKYIKAIGLDPSVYTVHKLRHTAATLMYKYGHTDIRALQSILGHESVATTQIYTHVDDQVIEHAIDNNPLNNPDL